MNSHPLTKRRPTYLWKRVSQVLSSTAKGPGAGLREPLFRNSTSSSVTTCHICSVDTFNGNDMSPVLRRQSGAGKRERGNKDVRRTCGGGGERRAARNRSLPLRHGRSVRLRPGSAKVRPSSPREFPVAREQRALEDGEGCLSYGRRRMY